VVQQRDEWGVVVCTGSFAVFLCGVVSSLSGRASAAYLPTGTHTHTHTHTHI
jgi:hypothetical protein